LKPWLASAGAVGAGFIVTALASTAADAVMHVAGIFPSAPRLMSDPLFALASAYRALFTVAGGYVTARLAPDRPMRHAWILAGIGLVAGLAGVVAYYAIGGAELGPAWYAISIPVEAIPCVWLGGRLAASRLKYNDFPRAGSAGGMVVRRDGAGPHLRARQLPAG
jgi:peptidoglycan/LPS O-acetylase OafA/YrhL